MKKIVTTHDKNGKPLLHADGTPRVRVQYLNTKPSRTQKAHAHDVDINNIVQKYTLNKLERAFDPTTGVYADFSGLPDYDKALQITMDAQKAFLKLPSTLRSKFNNDPQQLISYLSDPKNNEESISLGLRIKPPSPPPTPTVSLDDQTISKIKSEKKAKIVYED